MPALQQRRFQRFAVNVPCAVRPLHKYAGIKVQPISAETKDISRGGICFVANAAWKVGTEIECVLQLASIPPTVRNLFVLKTPASSTRATISLRSTKIF